MRQPWNMRLLHLAASLLAAVVLAICAHGVKVGFQGVSAFFAPVAEKRQAPPALVKSDAQDASSARQDTHEITNLHVNSSTPPSSVSVPAVVPGVPASVPPVVVPEMVKGGVSVTPVEVREEKAPFSLPYPAPPAVEKWRAMAATERLSNVRARVLRKLESELAARDCRLGEAAFIRIFKESKELELWLQGKKKEWRLFRTYPIACFSGTLGPKTREGDMQAPEGFYSVAAKQLNPASKYHLAFNVGYPNAYDLAQERTGDLIMVHGDLCSVGCFAMTDAVIEEIYLVVEAALKNGGSVPVHSFPFRMTAERMASAEGMHREFWQGLVAGYEVFEKEKRVPRVGVEGRRYVMRGDGNL